MGDGENDAFSTGNDEVKKQRYDRMIDSMTEPVSPRCPACTSSDTITRYHDGSANNSPFTRCYVIGDHFDHECRFCLYHWTSGIDAFTGKKLVTK